jgi:hypothetical protein
MTPAERVKRQIAGSERRAQRIRAGSGDAVSKMADRMQREALNIADPEMCRGLLAKAGKLRGADAAADLTRRQELREKMARIDPLSPTATEQHRAVADEIREIEGGWPPQFLDELDRFMSNPAGGVSPGYRHALDVLHVAAEIRDEQERSSQAGRSSVQAAMAKPNPVAKSDGSGSLGDFLLRERKR